MLRYKYETIKKKNINYIKHCLSILHFANLIITMISVYN